MLFKILWSIDAVAAFIVLYFFVIGLVDGTVSSFNMGIWMIILLILAVVLFGSIWLKSNQQQGFAIALQLVLAIPAILYLGFITIALLGNGWWN